MYIGLFAVGITCLVTYLSSSKGDKPAQSQEKQEKQTQVVQSVCVSKDEQQTSKTIVKEENSKKEPTQSPKVQAKQNLSEIDKSFYAVVTRSVEIHQNGQITHEVDLDKDGDGKADYRVKFNEAAFLSKGEKVNIVSLIKHPTFNNFSALAHQKERF